MVIFWSVDSRAILDMKTGWRRGVFLVVAVWKSLEEQTNFGWNRAFEFCYLVALPRISHTFFGMPLPYIISVYRLADPVLGGVFVPLTRPGLA